MSINLYRWLPYHGRGGKIEGLFLSTEEEVKKAIGKSYYLGEILGKHSSVYGEIEEGDIMLVSSSPSLIKEIFEHVTFSNNTLCGYNPLYYIQFECERCGNEFDEENMVGKVCYMCEEDMQADLEEE